MIINGLNSVMKRHRMAGWTKKQVLIISCLQELHLTNKDKIGLGWKDGERVSKANWPWNQVGVSTFTYDKTEFKPKIRRDEEYHFILIKEIIHKEVIINFNSMFGSRITGKKPQMFFWYYFWILSFWIDHVCGIGVFIASWE